MSLLRRFGRRTDPRESLLFVSPVMPALSGNGLAMRAAQTLLAFATRYRVSLLVIPLHGSPSGRLAPEPVRAVCDAVVVMGGEVVPSTLPFGHIEILHLFRLATVAPAEPLLTAFGARARLWIDFDDVESLVHRRIAALHGLRGDDFAAEASAEQARDAETREVAALHRFERVFLAGQGDGENLPLQGVADVRHLPNVLPHPALLTGPPSVPAMEILMVGTMGYFPNVEGALWFAREVLPRLRMVMRSPVAFRVVGAGWSALLEELRRVPYVEIVGREPDVQPHYERAHLVVVPVRAGGGSRIKLIEAFGLGRAVVATTVGAEGIAVADGEHLLLADDAETFAAACKRVLTDASLRAELIRNAREFVQRSHTPDVLAAMVAGWP